jgi:hypothetical protein
VTSADIAGPWKGGGSVIDCQGLTNCAGGFVPPGLELVFTCTAQSCRTPESYFGHGGATFTFDGARWNSAGSGVHDDAFALRCNGPRTTFVGVELHVVTASGGMATRLEGVVHQLAPATATCPVGSRDIGIALSR